MKGNQSIYKIIFRNQDKVYEIHAREVRQSELFGFVEISGMIFGETSDLLVDPAEEKLRAEFANLDFSLVPMHAIIRIDKVVKGGRNKIVENKGTDNVTHLPATPFTPRK